MASFLIFAFRKLCLTKRINQRNYQGMLWSREQQQIQDKISIMQQAQASIEDTSKQVLANITNIFSSSLQTQLGNINTNANNLLQQYNAAYAKVQGDTSNPNCGTPDKDPTVAALRTQMEQAQKDSYTQSMQLDQKNRAFQASMMAASGAMNSIFDTADKASLDYLHRKDNELSLKIKSNDSAVALLNNELQSVEKAEGDAAKDAAPKFGQIG